MSLLDETITITNPSFYAAIALMGYFISDHKKNHKYSFPPEFVLSPQSSVTLYCCPMKISSKPLNNSSEVLYWKNKDGSLRQAEVLLNDYDKVFLYNAQNVLISSCYQQKNSAPHSSRYGAIDNTFHSLRRLLIIVCRVVFILVHGYYSRNESSVLVQGFWGAFALDCLARYDSLLTSTNNRHDYFIIARCLWVEEDGPRFRTVIQGLNYLGDTSLTCFLYLQTISSHDQIPTALLFALLLNLASQTMHAMQVVFALQSHLV